MRRIAVVIPWFGADQTGGAEQQAWQGTTRLAARGHHVDVLTTCGRSFLDDWADNHFEPGVSIEAGLTIRRFPVVGRNRAAFDAANRELLAANDRPTPPGTCPVSRMTATTFVRENIHAPALYDYLSQNGARYTAVVFMPYLYGPTLRGLPLVADRAFLQPCLHDEAYAYLPEVEAVFHSARGILFNSEGEAELAARLYGPAMLEKGVCVGEGVEEAPAPATSVDDQPIQPAIRELIASVSRFILCLGRRDTTKNTDFLLRSFARFRADHPASRLSLVLAGPGALPAAEGADARAGVIDAGHVSAREKQLLLAHATALAQPSQNESYSRVMMEAWREARPVVVHGRCAATSRSVEACGGGWTADNETEWAGVFRTIDTVDSAELSLRGRRGEAYAALHADWNKVIARYEDVLRLRPRPASMHATAAPRKVEVH